MRKFLSGLLSVLIGLLSIPAGAADGLIAADEAYAAAGRGELLIIDVRTPAEWRETGIPEGAKTAEFGWRDGSLVVRAPDEGHGSLVHRSVFRLNGDCETRIL